MKIVAEQLSTVRCLHPAVLNCHHKHLEDVHLPEWAMAPLWASAKNEASKVSLDVALGFYFPEILALLIVNKANGRSFQVNNDDRGHNIESFDIQSLYHHFSV